VSVYEWATHLIITRNIKELSYIVQFQDPSVRRFNLIGLDFRGQGKTGGPIGPDWNQKDATNDVIMFMVSFSVYLYSDLTEYMHREPWGYRLSMFVVYLWER
jgi:hypothetical protein